MTTSLSPLPKTHRSGPVVMSIIERILARGASAVMTLLLAVFSGPTTVGKYATVILAMTVHQALTENVIRQIGVEAWNFENGSSFLRKSSFYSGALGFLIVTITAVLVTVPDGNFWLFICLLPLGLVPIVAARYLPILTRAQRSSPGWRSIARSQTMAAAVSLAVSGPLLPLVGVGAASLQLFVSETLFLILISRNVLADQSTDETAPLWRNYYFPTAVSSILGWSQSQLERFLLVLFASPGAVGVYSLAVAIARSASDAVTSGLVNAVRSQISIEASLHGKSRQLERGIQTGVAVSLVMQFLVTVACVYLLPRFLSPSWIPALSAAPLFAVTGVFAAVTWVCSAYLIATGNSSRMLSAQVVGIVLSVLCGFALSISLELGAFMCIVRDYVALYMRLRLIREAISQRLVYLVAVSILLALIVGFAPQYIDVR